MGLWTASACTRNKVVYKRYIEVINRIIFHVAKTEKTCWIDFENVPRVRLSPRNQNEIHYKNNIKTLSSVMESPRVALFKNMSEESPSSILPWWKKHDKVCFVWPLHVWENMMKCPWGDVSAEPLETDRCSLQCPTSGATAASDGQEYPPPVAQTTWSWWGSRAWSDHSMHTQLKQSCTFH